MGVFGRFIFLTFVLTCCRSEEILNNSPDLIVFIKSKSEKEYGLSMNYPLQFSCLKETSYPKKNRYIAAFSLKKDSSEYTIKNFDNRKEFYFTLIYNHQIIENYNENDIKIKFQDFKVIYSSADSFVMKGNELWIYCD
jgi:hypothetical protein